MDIITLIITLVVAAIVIVGGFWVVDRMELGAPWRTFALIIWGVISLAILLSLVYTGGNLGVLLHRQVSLGLNIPLLA